MVREMEKYISYFLALICMLAFASGIQAATVMVDPAILDSPEEGETLAVNVKIQDVAGLFGYEFHLSFDNTALKFSDIEAGEFLGSDDADTLAFLKVDEQQVYFDITPDMLTFFESSGQAMETEITSDIAAEINSAGTLTVVSTRLGGVTNIDGTGILAVITFEVLEVKGSTLKLENVELGTSSADSEAQLIPTDVEDGAITVAEIKGDVNGDREVSSVDAALALRISVGLETPTDRQKLMADMNDDGEIGADDALMILRKALESAAPGVGAVAGANGQIGIAMPEVHGLAGESITVPVNVDDTGGLAGGDISIYYDQKALRAVDVSFAPDVLLISNLNDPGMVRIAFANINGVGGKTLAEIRFTILADDTSPLTFKTVNLYTPNALPLVSRAIDGKFSSWAVPPESSALLQNFPNPFNPDTWIPYQLSAESDVSITIYNAVGKMVRRLDLGHKPAGIYRTQGRAAHWNGRNEAGELAVSGVYFVVLEARGYQEIRRVALIR